MFLWLVMFWGMLWLWRFVVCRRDLCVMNRRVLLFMSLVTRRMVIRGLILVLRVRRLGLLRL